MASSYVYSGNVIDIEASGMGKNSYPIEIALVTHTGKLYQSLILPDDSWTYWSDKAERVHGITKNTIKRMGRSTRQVCTELNNLFAGELFYSDCWSLDSKWLSTLFESAGMVPAFTIRSTDYILDNKDISNWALEKTQLAKVEGVNEHRALADAYIIKSLLDTKIESHQRKNLSGALKKHQRNSARSYPNTIHI